MPGEHEVTGDFGTGWYGVVRLTVGGSFKGIVGAVCIHHGAMGFEDGRGLVYEGVAGCGTPRTGFRTLPPPKPDTVPPKEDGGDGEPCVDSDNGTLDSGKMDCAAYSRARGRGRERVSPWCGLYDVKGGFDSWNMCCACKAPRSVVGLSGPFSDVEYDEGTKELSFALVPRTDGGATFAVYAANEVRRAVGPPAERWRVLVGPALSRSTCLS